MNYKDRKTLMGILMAMVIGVGVTQISGLLPIMGKATTTTNLDPDESIIVFIDTAQIKMLVGDTPLNDRDSYIVRLLRINEDQCEIGVSCYTLGALDDEESRIASLKEDRTQTFSELTIKVEEVYDGWNEEYARLVLSLPRIS